MIRQLFLLALTTFVLGHTHHAAAQDVPAESLPIGRFVADVRGAFPGFKQDPNIAAGIGVTPENLPGRALGLVVGAHFYPLRIRMVTIGIGGEIIRARRGKTLEPATPTGTATPGGTPTPAAAPGPTVNSRFASLSPQVSFNLGARDGWSYISGGMGSSTFTAERADAPLPPQETRSKTINYGGGARWFSKKHVALSVDLRFYAINPQIATATRPAVSRMTLVTFNVGMALK